MMQPTPVELAATIIFSLAVIHTFLVSKFAHIAHTYPNGSVYEGQFEDGKPHGRGRITYADGGTYEGDWVRGEITGQGRATYANGSTYEGGF